MKHVVILIMAGMVCQLIGCRSSNIVVTDWDKPVPKHFPVYCDVNGYIGNEWSLLRKIYEIDKDHESDAIKMLESKEYIEITSDKCKELGVKEDCLDYKPYLIRAKHIEGKHGRYVVIEWQRNILSGFSCMSANENDIAKKTALVIFYDKIPLEIYPIIINPFMTKKESS